MTTVIVRTATPPIADTVTPDCSTLAELTRRIVQQGFAVGLTVHPVLYRRAEAEMYARQQTRGYSSVACAQIPQRNFLLFGVPVICGDD